MGTPVAGALGDLTRTKAELVAENALLGQQLIVRRRQVRRPALIPADRRRLVLCWPVTLSAITSWHSCNQAAREHSGWSKWPAQAAHCGCPRVEFDALNWGPGWQAVPTALFRERADAATVGPCWVADGDDSAVRDVVRGRADTITWLDYALPINLWHLTRRTFARRLRGEELWGVGNRESLRTHFLSRDSLSSPAPSTPTSPSFTCAPRAPRAAGSGER